MERSGLYNIKRQFARIALAGGLTFGVFTPILAPEASAEKSSEQKPPSASPTPILEFPIPSIIKKEQPPVFRPMPVTQNPEKPWTSLAEVTFYCLPGLTYSETPVREGVIATDPRTIPLGSIVDIEGLGQNFIAEDTGTGITGWHLDVWNPSCEESINLGRLQRRVLVKRWGWK